MENFKLASKEGLTIKTKQGQVYPHQLWDYSRDELNDIAVELDELLSKEPKKTFIRKVVKKDRIAALRLAIVIEIIDYKTDEMEREQKNLSDKEYNQKLTDILASKKEQEFMESLEGKSSAEIAAMMRR